MRLTTAGVPAGFDKSIVGVVTTLGEPKNSRSEKILVTPNPSDDLYGYRGIVTSCHVPDNCSTVPIIYRTREIDHLKNGDIIVLEPGSGFVRSLYRPADKHNSLFVTERCNSNCLMCSQPPKDKDDSDRLMERNLELIRLMKPAPEYLTITGGEPTLLDQKLLTLLAALRDYLPTTEVHILTNGRRFAWPDFTRRFTAVGHSNLSVGIPLYSDLASVHDYVVQAKDAFDQTVMGLHHLARWNQRIEIRIVLHAQTISRLPQLAEYIYRNLTFVEHIALMGLENIGYAPRNMEKLWIDPAEYQRQLHEAVTFLRHRGMAVSIYNHQLCVLKPELWKYAKKSISDWKNIYISECEHCSVQERCGGFFAWATKLHSAHIHAL
jgi:His-Xaa-Ser system radical SAM maturase HxsC